MFDPKLTQAGDQRWVRTAGSALHLLHSLYGPFSKIYGIGRCSKVRAAVMLSRFHVSTLKSFVLAALICVQMAYESWREQVEEGEQRSRQAEIGKVFLIDRGEKPTRLHAALCSLPLPNSTHSLQMWTLSLLYARKLSTRDSWMTYLESNVVSIDQTELSELNMCRGVSRLNSCSGRPLNKTSREVFPLSPLIMQILIISTLLEPWRKFDT